MWIPFFSAIAAVLAGPAEPQQPPSAPASIVFFDIAGENSDRLQTFYAEVFGWRAGAGGQLSIPISAPIAATIRQDPAEKRLYIGVGNITATLALIKEKGGTIDAPRFEVKGVAVLALFRDPAGNPMGLVELENGKRKIP
jgi:predicted enzyme related to lactoylglutathione lyase